MNKRLLSMLGETVEAAAISKAYFERTGSELGRLQYRRGESRFFGMLMAAEIYEPELAIYCDVDFWDEALRHCAGLAVDDKRRGIKAVEMALNTWEAV